MWLRLTAFALVLAVAGVWIVYRRDIRLLADALAAGSKTLDSPFGTIEYTEFGEGVPVLVSHGTMAGYDGGVVQARTYLTERYRFIVPSRFGYGRSSVPPGASFELQADAYQYLLDHLGIEKAFVQGMSAGGPPAVQFAARHPDHCLGLVLLSTAGFAPGKDERKFPLPGFVYRALVWSDFFYWALVRAAPGMLESAFGAGADLKARSTPEELAGLRRVIGTFLPISVKGRASLNLDGPWIDALEPFPLDQIRSPALVIAAADDTVAPKKWSEGIADGLPGTQLVIYPSGGHILLGHQAEVRRLTDTFIDATLALPTADLER